MRGTVQSDVLFYTVFFGTSLLHTMDVMASQQIDKAPHKKISVDGNAPDLQLDAAD